MARAGRFDFHSIDELRDKTAELGLDLPVSDGFGILLQPVDMSGRRLKNRFVIHPMEGADAEPDGGPGALTFRRYERYARGGAGMIWFEAAAVVPEGRSNPRQLRLTAKTLDAFKRLVEISRKAGRTGGPRDTDPFLILQLTHSGRFSKPDGPPAPITGRRDPILDPLPPIASAAPVVSDDGLRRIQDAFVETARLAVEAGFDGVDVKACHGYLAAELLSGHFRTGDFGGSFENRTRFLRETIRAIREAAPRLSCAVRLNVWDGFPYPAGFGASPENPEREDPAEPLRLAAELGRNGIEFLNITAGIPHFRPHIGRPYDAPVRGGSPSPEHPLIGVARLIRMAGTIQTGAAPLPVVGTGYSWLRFLFPHVAAAAVASGRIALIGVGRLAFAYPDFVRDLAENGRMNPRKVCTACSGCSTLTRSGRPAGCVVRDSGFYKT